MPSLLQEEWQVMMSSMTVVAAVRMLLSKSVEAHPLDVEAQVRQVCLEKSQARACKLELAPLLVLGMVYP